MPNGHEPLGDSTCMMVIPSVTIKISRLFSRVTPPPYPQARAPRSGGVGGLSSACQAYSSAGVGRSYRATYRNSDSSTCRDFIEDGNFLLINFTLSKCVYILSICSILTCSTIKYFVMR